MFYYVHWNERLGCKSKLKLEERSKFSFWLESLRQLWAVSSLKQKGDKRKYHWFLILALDNVFLFIPSMLQYVETPRIIILSYIPLYSLSACSRKRQLSGRQSYMDIPKGGITRVCSFWIHLFHSINKYSLSTYGIGCIIKPAGNFSKMLWPDFTPRAVDPRTMYF